jgi:hypothetical protein
MILGGTGWMVVLMIGTLLMVGGCAKNASSQWAQTAPIIKADPGASSAVNLGVRGG